MSWTTGPWPPCAGGHYLSVINGRTRKFDGAMRCLDYFGLVDFTASTLVLCYRGEVCYPK